MNLLFPLFLAGAVFIGGPILFHLIRRSTKNRVAFSATQFLEESPPSMQRRNRIQNPWLLLLRCLIVALLAFAFSRPFLSRNIPIVSTAAPPRVVTLVIDESASMQRPSLWQAAQSTAISIISELGPSDRLAIFAISDAAERVLSFEQWDDLPATERSRFASNLIQSRNPGWRSSYLDLGVEAAIEELEQIMESTAAKSTMEIKLISDFALGARIAGLAGREWPEGSTLELIPLATEEQSNISMQWLGISVNDDDAPRNARISLTSNARANSTAFTVTLRDAQSGKSIGKPNTLYALPNDKRLIQIDVPHDHAGPFVVELEGDELEFDNRLFIAPPQPRETTVSYIGSQDLTDTTGSYFYLHRATLGWNDPKITTRSFSDPRSFDTADSGLDDSAFIVVDRPLSQSEVTTLRNRIENGAFALVLLEDSSRVATAAALAGEPDWAYREVKRNDALLGSIDFQSPLFSLFADPKFSDFTRIRFWNPISATLPDTSPTRIAARFDDDSPAILEKSIGSGSLIIWGGGWSPQASQWVLSSKFVPWLQHLVERALGGNSRPSHIAVGEEDRATATPNAEWKPLTAEEYSTDAPREPGLYLLNEDNRERWVAVQFPSEESLTETLPIDAWEQLDVPLNSPARNSQLSKVSFATQQRLQNAMELEGQQQLWRWAIILSVVLLAMESGIAIISGKRREVADG